jgi:hypothetical protein
MPAFTRKQRIAAAIAEHHPEKLHKANRGMLQMSKEQLHDYASGPLRKKSKLRVRLAETKREDIDR